MRVGKAPVLDDAVLEGSDDGAKLWVEKSMDGCHGARSGIMAV